MWRILLGLIVIAGASGETVMAQEVKCGESYVARQGDTVYGVATRVKSSGMHRLLLVNALSAKYGGPGGAIEEGAVMSVPCADGQTFDLPSGFWSQVAYRPMDITVQIVAPRKGAAPDTFGANPLFTALLDGAMRKSLFVAEYQSLKIGDYNALAPFPEDLKAGDISFPWLGSDCLGEHASAKPGGALCADAYWSDPLFDITSSLYSLETDDPATVDLQAGRVCLAQESRAAVAASDIIDVSFAKGAVAGTALECADMLAARTVAAAILPDIAAAAINRSSGKARRIERVLDLTFSDKIHAVVDKANPNARRILKRLNEGVAAIRVSGEWYQIVVTQLRERYLN